MMASKRQVKVRNHEEVIAAGKEYLRQERRDRDYMRKHGHHPISSPDVEIRKKAWVASHRWARALDLVGVSNIVKAFEASRAEWAETP
jgi:hypothetical protein